MSRLSRTLALIAGVGLLAGIPTRADNKDDFFNSLDPEMKAFLDGADKEMDDFLKSANEEMVKMLGKPWEEFLNIPTPKPQPDPEPEPVILDDDIHTRPDPKPRPVIIETIVTPPAPKPAPTPVSPIKEIPAPAPLPDVSFTYYGTPMKVRGVALNGFGISGRRYADGWQKLMDLQLNNLVLDLLKLRDDYALCDWAFMNVAQKAASKLTNGRPNETAMLTCFLLAQCGYQMRLCEDSVNRLHTLFACNGILYDSGYYNIKGQKYYPLTPPNGATYICDFAFPKEQVVDMGITRNMKLAYAPGQTRTVTAKYVPDFTVTVTPNKNLIDFYNDYPASTLDDTPYTKWAVYANVPVSPELKKGLYPKAKEVIAGKSQREAANALLHMAQSFPYGYDEKIWGHDRAFFPDETWQYPYSDCEDHAIHFSRMVRDLMGLDVVLVYYPGHLASAVAFTDPSITGDYINYRGKKFTVCDPTIFYSNIGQTMTGMDNSKAILVDLKR